MSSIYQTHDRGGAVAWVSARIAARFWSLWRPLVRHRRRVLALCALFGLAMVPGLLRLETDNSPEVFFLRGSAAVERYHELRAQFGSDHSLRLALGGDGLFTAEGLAWLAELERRAAATPGVDSASGLTLAPGAGVFPPADPEAYRDRARADPLARRLGWIDAPGTTATTILLLDELSPSALEELVDELERRLEGAPPGVEAEVVGLPVLNLALNRLSREIEQLYFPLLVAFAVLILLAAVRDFAGIVVPLTFVGYCELLLLASMGYAGVRLNMVLAVLPPLLFAIALATTVHLLLHFRDLRAVALGDQDADAVAAALAATYRDKGWSVLWTGLTTMVGFGALSVSPLAPVRSLGIWAAVGFALMTVAAFLVLPPLLLESGARGADRSAALRSFERRTRVLGRRWGRFAGTRRRAVIAAAAVVAALALAGLPRLDVETNALRYLAAGHPARAGIERLEERGIGLAALEVLITEPGEAPFRNAIALARLEQLAAELLDEELVLGAWSAGGLLEAAAARAPTVPMLDPASRRQAILGALLSDPETRPLLATLLDEERTTARLTLFVETVGIDRLDPLRERVAEAAVAAFPDATIEITGRFPLLLEAQRYLVSTLALSLGLTLLCVTVILRLLLPGWRLALLALLPNLWPVLGVFGIMGWAGVPLDIATVMVASVVLGLAVDDTIHTLGHFRHLAPEGGARRAVVQTLEITAPAYLLTGVILIAGFGVCALSDFAPTARFGALSACAILFALAGDLFLLPAFLSLTPKKTIGRLGEKLSSRARR